MSRFHTDAARNGSSGEQCNDGDHQIFVCFILLVGKLSDFRIIRSRAGKQRFDQGGVSFLNRSQQIFFKIHAPLVLPVIFRLIQLVFLQGADAVPCVQHLVRDGDLLAGDRSACEVEMQQLHQSGDDAEVLPGDRNRTLHPVAGGVGLKVRLRSRPDGGRADRQGKGADGHDSVEDLVVFKVNAWPVAAAVFFQRASQRLLSKAGMRCVFTACPASGAQGLPGRPKRDRET